MTGNELETRSNGGNGLEAQMRYAQALAASSLLPRAYQRQPANVLIAMQMGDALGIPPIQAINSIHVIEGKPTASADLIASLVRRAGHKLRIKEAPDGSSVTATLIRSDDPDFAFEATWTMAKAQQAGLTGKGVWKQYPGQMLRNRAITEVCRQGAGDALFSVIYTPEELGHDETATPSVTAHVEQPQAQASDAPELPADAEPHPDFAGLKRAMDAAGVTAEDALTMARAMTGRELASAGELSADEVDILIEHITESSPHTDVVDAEVVDEPQETTND